MPHDKTFRKDAGYAFAAILKPLGFKKQGLAWQRQSGLFVDLIDIQVSQFSRDFTVNLGVGIQAISDDLFTAKFTVRRSCDGLVEMRLGLLATDGHDLWWPKDESLKIQDAAEKLRIFGPMFFEKYHDTEEMIRTLESGVHDTRLTFPKSFYLALLHIQFGSRQEGCKILSEIAKRPPAPWNEPALGLLHKHSCSS
jgi:Domain of unknown function (DUF4304)